jgi:hypothetical protein
LEKLVNNIRAWGRPVGEADTEAFLDCLFGAIAALQADAEGEDAVYCRTCGWRGTKSSDLYKACRCCSAPRYAALEELASADVEDGRGRG